MFVRQDSPPAVPGYLPSVLLRRLYALSTYLEHFVATAGCFFRIHCVGPYALEGEFTRHKRPLVDEQDHAPSLVSNHDTTEPPFNLTSQVTQT